MESALFDLFSQSQFGCKLPCCTEGERARNQERVCLLDKGNYQRPDLWKMEKAGLRCVWVTEGAAEGLRKPEEFTVILQRKTSLFCPQPGANVSVLQHFGWKKTRTKLMSSSTVHDLFLAEPFVRAPYHLLEHYAAVKPVFSSRLHL